MSELIIYPDRIRWNARYLSAFCQNKGLEIMGVVKGCAGFLPVIEAFTAGGISHLGMSRIQDAAQISQWLAEGPFMISLPSPNEALDIIRHFSGSVHSELDTIKAVAEAADRHGKDHRIILMMDTGDLREGLTAESAAETVRQIRDIRSRHLKFDGLGANLGCCSGTLPDRENLRLLNDLAADAENCLGRELRTVSIGGSVILDWLEYHELPPRINQIRIGEAILLGNIPTVNRKHPDLFDNAMLFRGTVVEVQLKPSKPPGRQGSDAFGRRLSAFQDRGLRKRAILNFGFLDTDAFGLTPRNHLAEIITSNSDYTVLDVTDCDPPISVGDVLEFDMNYHAMIQGFMSPYVSKRLLESV